MNQKNFFHERGGTERGQHGEGEGTKRGGHGTERGSTKEGQRDKGETGEHRDGADRGREEHAERERAPGQADSTQEGQVCPQAQNPLKDRV